MKKLLLTIITCLLLPMTLWADFGGRNLVLWRQVGGVEYRLYKAIDWSDYLTNADGWNMYRTALTLDVISETDSLSVTVGDNMLYTSEDIYNNGFRPTMMIDVANNQIYVFANSKFENGSYTMVGYAYTSALNQLRFSQEVVYESMNFGWWPTFSGVENGQPVLRFFSYAGYFGIVARRLANGTWEMADDGDISPDDYGDAWRNINKVAVNGNTYTDEVEVSGMTYTLRDSQTAWISWIPNRTTLTEYDIPSTIETNGTVYNVTGIAPFTFHECRQMTRVSIPASVNYIDESAFATCTGLQSIQVYATTPPTLRYGSFGVLQFSGVDVDNCVLYVPAGTADVYRNTEGWNQFRNVEEMGVVVVDEAAAAPTFRFTDGINSNQLSITSTTEGADIYYVMTDLYNPDMSVLDGLRNGQGTLYTEPLNVNRNAIIMAYAARQDLQDSEISTLEYSNAVWQELLEIYPMVEYVIDQAEQQNADDDIKNQIYSVAAYTEQTVNDYEETRTPADEIEERTSMLRAELEYILDQLSRAQRSSFDGLTARVIDNDSLDDAFANGGTTREAAAQTIAAIVWEANYALTPEMLQGIDNPNLLIFVANDTLASYNINNVVVDGIATDIVLQDATGNNNFYAPRSFSVQRISYTRNFSQYTQPGVSRGWESIALPFDVQTITHESKGVISPFGSAFAGNNFWLRRMTDNGLESVTSIQAYQPYVISMPNSDAYPEDYNLSGQVSFVAENVTVPASQNVSVYNADYSLALISAFQRVQQAEGVYALNVGETRGDYREGSVFESGYREVRPFEAYTRHYNRGDARSYTKYVPIDAMLKDAPTGIGQIRISTNDADAVPGDLQSPWYSLDGRKLNGRPTAKGVYIQNGQKVVLK